MFHTRNIADELAGIRSEINALKRREQMLREMALADPDSPEGHCHEVVIKTQKRRGLLRDRLPAHILKDPAYWEEREVPAVTLCERAASDVVNLATHRHLIEANEPKATRAVRPGDPVAEPPVRPVLKLIAQETDQTDVLENFAG
ncbi:hypothetical protein [Roseovarius aestuarii]|uniref:Uncharacterized protein n=1 Tax=Roseovarius aestuarii TaxID=475083 RepID=A0A1X7BV53_9RHOB|nr:hypothetical protein [Roseovarius aestuarii]SMC13541.1 hypothetical protein ROA7745_03391 [Roseovarius aestuarii]